MWNRQMCDLLNLPLWADNVLQPLIKFSFLPQDAPAGTLWSRNGATRNATWRRTRTLWCPSTSGVSMPVTSSSSSSELAPPSASGPPLTGRLASRSAASTDRACRLWPSSARQGQTARSKEGSPNASPWRSPEGPRVCGTYSGKAEMLKVVCRFYWPPSFPPSLPLCFCLSTVQSLSFHLLHFNPAKQPQQRGVSLNLRRVGGVGVASAPGSPARDLGRLVQLQRDKLQALESRLLGCEAELRDWDESAGEANEVSKNQPPAASERSLTPALFSPMSGNILRLTLPVTSQHHLFFTTFCFVSVSIVQVEPFSAHQGGNLEEELLLLEQQLRRNDAEMEEEEFWQNELQIEQDSERQLRQQLAELQGCVRECEAKLSEYLSRIQVSSARRSYPIPWKRVCGFSPAETTSANQSSPVWNWIISGFLWRLCSCQLLFSIWFTVCNVTEHGGGPGAGAAAAGGRAQPEGQWRGGTTAHKHWGALSVQLLRQKTLSHQRQQGVFQIHPK